MPRSPFPSLPASASFPRRIVPASVLVLFVCCLLRPASAQFAGPSPIPSASANLPVHLTTDPAILYPGEREIELGPGDQIAVHIFDTTDYSPSVRVSLDGSVQLPLIGVIHVAGLTMHQSENAIARRLIDAGMYRNPQVSVQLIDSPNQIVTVTGEIHAVVPIVGGNRRLFDVIATAGGFTAFTSHLITINRPGQAEPIQVDLGPDPSRSAQSNIPIYARDTIVISRVGAVYVLGAFRTQGAVPVQQSSPLTLLQAVSLANGAGYEGKYSDLRLIRTVGLERKVIHVDLQKIFDGKAPDPILQAEDIVYLPTSAFKAAIKSGGIGTLLGVISLLVATTAN